MTPPTGVPRDRVPSLFDAIEEPPAVAKAATAPKPAPAAPAVPTATPVAAASPASSGVLADLNDEQRAAVTHGEGPLMIVAGAGTGKTEVLTRRIAWLIGAKRARPEQILALTFTDKAAAEMESRVDALVPYGFTGSTICTFHAFGDGLLREHAVELGLTSQLRVETEAEILVFLREHVFELGLDRYLPLGNPEENLRDLVKLFDRLRDQGVGPEEYLEFAKRLEAGAADDVTRDRAVGELEKARAYGAYERLLLENGRLDFGSQIALALKLLRVRPYLRREYEERFRYILVDEFQDTNHVQFELVRTLAAAHRNLTVVGDDDQSIYRFRGARIENLLGFLDAFKGAKVQLLTRNYRSGQVILDRAHRMIQNNNPQRLEAMRKLDKRLVAQREPEGVVEFESFRTMSDEADWVANDIHDSITSGARIPGDIAVLARNHQYLDAVALALKARGIRFQRMNARSLYSRPEVQLVLNVLRVIANPDDSIAAFHVLGDPLYGVDPVDLARLAARAQRRNAGLLGSAIAAARDPESELAEPSREAIRRFGDLHRQLAASAVRRATTEVMFEFAEASGLLGQLASADSPESIEQANNLNKLFHIAARIGPLLKTDRVGPFVVHLGLLIDAGDDPAAAEVDIDEDAVHLLTAHNAKGLEFPVVYMVRLVEGGFPLWRRGERMAPPPELMGDPDAAVDHDREERRLFYVGMTRARDRLVLTHAVDYGGKAPRKLSRFVVEALNLPAGPRRTAPVSSFQSIARFAPGAVPDAPEIPVLPPDAPLSLSHYAIDDYLTCPLKYRYAHVVHMPIERDPRAMFGMAIHHAIKIFLRHRMKGLPIEEADVIATFEGAWSNEGFLSREHEERRLEEGREMLRRFVAREMQNRIVPVAVEAEFRFVTGPNTITGRWDRIDDRKGEKVIVDYKTSDVDESERAETKVQKSLEDEQLGLYALAYAETRGGAPNRVELYYVQSGLVGSAEVSADHLERARQRIARAAEGIRAQRFTAEPEARRCRYCPYSRFCPSSMARSGAL